eukprot:1273634-Amphidinium_carterae.1
MNGFKDKSKRRVRRQVTTEIMFAFGSVYTILFATSKNYLPFALGVPFLRGDAHPGNVQHVRYGLNHDSKASSDKQLHLHFLSDQDIHFGKEWISTTGSARGGLNALAVGFVFQGEGEGNMLGTNIIL